MTNKYRRARKKRKKWWPYLLSFFLLVVLGSGIGAYLAKPSLFSGLQFWKAKKTAVTTHSSSKKKKEKSDLPAVSTKDWQLILVNRDNVKPELNPQLTDVDAIKELQSLGVKFDVRGVPSDSPANVDALIKSAETKLAEKK